MADNAQYWVGECYYSKKLLNEAIMPLTKPIEIPLNEIEKLEKLPDGEINEAKKVFVNQLQGTLVAIAARPGWERRWRYLGSPTSRSSRLRLRAGSRSRRSTRAKRNRSFHDWNVARSALCSAGISPRDNSMASSPGSKRARCWRSAKGFRRAHTRVRSATCRS